MSSTMIPLGQLGVAVCVVLVAISAITDVRSRTIPNAVTLGGVVLAIALHVALGAVDDGLAGAGRGFGRALLGVAVAGLLPLLAFARGELGGGDVKLFFAIGAFLGPGLGLEILELPALQIRGRAAPLPMHCLPATLRLDLGAD